MEPAADLELDADEAGRRLANALRFRTVSHDEPARTDAAGPTSDDAFRELRT